MAKNISNVYRSALKRVLYPWFITVRFGMHRVIIP